MCGENDIITPFAIGYLGSPPRVRGKPLDQTQAKAGIRITPACAGKTLTAQQVTNVPQDHPRVCGENSKFPSVLFCNTGSPPRVRGKPTFPLTSFSLFGITPACAGKTTSLADSLKPPRDHPRVCGENLQFCKALRSQQGSPPRVRGKRYTVVNERKEDGITPACAGKTVQEVSLIL